MKKNTKEILMTKGEELISKKGYYDTKVEDITKESGVAKGTFYIYFESKEELFMEMINKKGEIHMPRMKWDKLNQRQLGQYGEYYAKMEFASYGYDVYTSEVDDHGVDFVARDIVTGTFYEVQVKSIYKGKYTYMQKQHMSVDDKYRLVCFLKFEDDRLPEVYIIPATAWQKPNAILVDRKYDKPGQKSKPEWGISYTIKNKKLIEKYKAENFFG